MRPTTRLPAISPAAIVGVGILFLLVYAGLLGITLTGADSQVRRIEQLAIFDAAATSLPGEVTNFIFLDGRFASRRELSPEQLERLREAKDKSFRKAIAGVAELESFLERRGDSAIQTFLTRLNSTSTRRVALQEQIYDPVAGLQAAFSKARLATDNVFTAVSERVPLPTSDYLAARTAQNDFLGNLSAERAREATAALDSFKAKTRTFPGLSSAQRRDLVARADDYGKAFTALSAAHLEFRAIGQFLQTQVVDIEPQLTQLERDVHARTAALRKDQSEARRTRDLATAGIGVLATLAFGGLAAGAYRRVRLRDQNLREASQRFLDFARATSDMFWEISPTGRVRQIIGNLRPFFGSDDPPEDLSLADWAARIGLDAESLQSVLAAQLPFRDLEHAIDGNGSLRWYQTAGVAMFDAHGNFAGLRCASRDITEEKTEATARLMLEQRMAAIVDNLPVTMFRVEGRKDDARFAYVGANAEKMIGHTVEELLAKPLNHDHWFVVEEDRKRFGAELARGLESTGHANSRARVRLPDGSVRWIQQISRRVPRPHPGAPGAVEGLWLDVTEEETRLRQITDFGEAIDSTDQAIYIVDRGTKEITYASQGYARMFGLSEEDLKNRRYVGQLGRRPIGRSMAEVTAAIEAGVNTPEGWHGEFSYENLDGEIRHILGSARLLSDNRRVVVLTDITARVRQEQETTGFRAALDHAADGVLIFEAIDKPIAYANGAIRRIMRLPDNTRLEGHYVHTYMPNRRAQMLDLREHIAERLVHESHVDIQREALRADGTPIIAHIRVTQLPDKRVLLALTDVTQRTFLEREVRARRDELSRLVSNLPGVAYRLEWKGDEYVPMFIGPRIAEFSGHPNQSSLDVSPQGAPLISESDAVLRRQAMAEARTKGAPYEVVWRMLTKTADVRWVMERGEHIVLPDGSLVAEGYLTDVTSRISYEAELERNREQSALIMRALNTAEEVVVMLDPNDHCTFINQAGIRMVGVAGPESVLGRHQSEFLRYDGASQLQTFREMRAALVKSRQWRGEITATRADGAELILRAFIGRNVEGPTIILANDVTKEVRVRRANERRARVMSDLGTDKEIQLLDTAEAMGRIVRAAAEGLDAPLTSIWLFSERADDMMALMAYDTRSQVSRSGILVPMKGHEEYLAQISARRLIIAPVVEDHPALASFTEGYFIPAGVRSAMNIPIVRDNRTIGVLTCEDTTPRAEWLAEEVQFAAHVADFAALMLESIARRKTLNELAVTNQRLSQVVRALDSAQDQILIQDADKNVTYANRRALDLIGAASLREVRGRRTLDVLLSHVENVATVSEQLNDALAAGTPWNQEVALLSPRQGRRDLEVRVSGLEGGGVIYAATDITERKQREGEQQILRRQLSDAQRLEAIGSLAGGIAHDFNNIIGATRGFADLLVSDLAEGTEPHHYAGRIVAACRRAAALVKEIMAFSRVKDAERTAVAVVDLVSEAEDILLSRPDKNLSLDVVNAAGAEWINANASQMTQVLSNLLINAADAMSTTGAIELHVDTIKPDALMLEAFAREGVDTHDEAVLTTTQGSLSPKATYVRFSIADHGSGIAAPAFAHIFEPFFTTKDKSRGTGLGLAVVAGIVESHRGAIRVVTRPGVGTRFEVFIPRAEGRHAAPAPKMTSAVKKGLRGHERVLIVDDESDLAEALAIALGRLGYETAPIFHPLEALEIFSEDPNAWDIVISDQSMPKLKGLELIRQLRALRPGLKAIICTGFSDALDADRAGLEGIDAFFHKPVTAETLARTIRGLFA